MINVKFGSAEFYPCEECREHLKKYFEKHPPKLEGREELVEYFCQLHNILNKILKKSIFDCKLMEQTYGGECDECKKKTLSMNDAL